MQCFICIQRDVIYRESIFEHFLPKTNTKTIGIYGVLGCCCVLLENQILVSYEMGEAN